MFLWLACHNRLSTKNQLFKRHILFEDSCPLCLSPAKITIHILWDCPYTSTIWRNSSNPTIPHNFFTLNLPNWVKLISSPTPPTSNHNTIPWHIISPLIAWCIWTACKKFVMENIPFSAQDISIKAKSLAQDVWHLIPTKNAPIKNITTHIGWTPPPVGFFKLNTDGSTKENPSLAMASGLIRDHNRSWITSFTKSIGFTHLMAAKL